ncbi:hypothetical protein [Photobacterium profundum]|uniref:Uncharacterized protein n=1 Tax=Photobacterium profundum (strain SS9) TaxID=298386 RepID=Q6LHT7_PHOPR|nr:hypothetical protein [Photobacterium profundum]CAG23143.1 hypothetical protein PBPRB1272 [Photobacterium profundum SS9]
MTIKSSGTISMQDIVDEFGGEPPHALTEYYRGGGRVPDNPQNSRIPTSGTISLIDFYGAVNEIVRTITTGGLKATFGAFWRQNIPKRAIINGGVTRALLTIESGMKGTLVIDNYGEIQGYGGSEGRKGGDAVIVDSANITINNHGAIRGGGGGGGRGGVGGRGRYVQREPFSGEIYTQTTRYTDFSEEAVSTRIFRLTWGGAQVWQSQTNFLNPSAAIGGWTYVKGSLRRTTPSWQYPRIYSYAVYRSRTNYTHGGTGGVGGRGQGYGQGKQNGSAGRDGGRNAGRGGAGGNGGGWAQTGIRGRTGANGNSGGASQGAYGGRGGWAIKKKKKGRNVTINNLGTINGRIA